MAYENAESRIPLGVHFRMDAKESLKLGYRIGRKVINFLLVNKLIILPNKIKAKT